MQHSSPKKRICVVICACGFVYRALRSSMTKKTRFFATCLKSFALTPVCTEHISPRSYMCYIYSFCVADMIFESFHLSCRFSKRFSLSASSGLYAAHFLCILRFRSVIFQWQFKLFTFSKWRVMRSESWNESWHFQNILDMASATNLLHCGQFEKKSTPSFHLNVAAVVTTTCINELILDLIFQGGVWTAVYFKRRSRVDVS